MINNALKILIILFFSGCADQNVSLMTYNIRLDIEVDGDNAWTHRKEFLVSQLLFYTPDIFGTQEGLPHQISYIDNELGNYSYIGDGRDGGEKGEYVAIFFKHTEFEVTDQHTFWLSETPGEFSKGWDAAYPRICTYGLFKDKKTNKKFWVINTHLDHMGSKAREQSVLMIIKKIKEINIKNYPLFFLGDLNAEPKSNPILTLKSILDDSKEVSIEKPFGPRGTFNAFKFDEPVVRRIDYIFISKNNTIKVNKYAVLSDSKDLRYPSDHLPVYVELTFN